LVTLVAVMVYTPAVDGALYVADLDGLATFVNVPHAFPVQFAPEAVQVTPAFAMSFVTVTVKFRVCVTGMPPRIGVRFMLRVPAGVTVIVAAALFAEFATEVAVSVTVAGAGTLPGVV
jgi:hypothetical protein